MIFSAFELLESELLPPSHFKFYRLRKKYRFKVALVDYEEVLVKLVDEAIEQAMKAAKDDGWLVPCFGLTISSENLSKPVNFTWKPKDRLGGRNVLASFEKISQSTNHVNLFGAPIEIEVMLRVEKKEAENES